MFQLDLKRIETAINGGRLDEAFDRLTRSAERSHRDGQRLIESLSEALAQRAEQHLNEERCEDAESDIRKAIELAGRKPELADLRDRVFRRRDEQSRLREREDVVHRSVQNRILASQFTLAAKLIPDRKDGEPLAETLDQHRLVLEDVAQKMDRAIERQDPAEVIGLAQSLEPQLLHHQTIRSRVKRAVEPMLAQSIADFTQGRLDRVSSFVQAIAAIGIEQAEVSELAQASERCRVAKRAIEQSRWADADRELGLLAQVYPDPDWLRDARQSIAEIMRSQHAIQSGALGLLDANGSVSKPMVPSTGEKVRPTNQSMILQVDGLGGILLLTDDVLSIGSASRSGTFDLPLLTDGPHSPIEIRRSGEDYFVQSASEFLVNDQPTRRRLLVSNETIQFGRRGRVKFRRPVPASGSAVLQLTGAALPRRDVRYVALMCDSLVFASTGGHFTVPHSNGPLVLYRDRDGFVIKQPGERGLDRQKLNLGQPLLVGETRFSLRQITLC